MFLHVGLGNPGKSYESDRHNVGFMAIDTLIRYYESDKPKLKFNGLLSQTTLNSKKILFLKPQTYMNKSGSSVSSIMNFFSIPISSVVVWHDEIDLNQAKVKVKVGGGHGGHNGIRDIENHIGKDFKRVRIGVGRPENSIPASNWVLSSFKKEDFIDWLDDLLKLMAKESFRLINDDTYGFMNIIAQTYPQLKDKQMKNDEN